MLGYIGYWVGQPRRVRDPRRSWACEKTASLPFIKSISKLRGVGFSAQHSLCGKRTNLSGARYYNIIPKSKVIHLFIKRLMATALKTLPNNV